MAINDRVDERIQHKSLTSVVEERLRSLIRKGELKPNDRIPSHEELCKRWGVSLTTIRDALGRLEAAGIVEKTQGRGTFVNTVALDRLLTYHEINGQLVEEDIFHSELAEVRLSIEPRIAELAAERRKPEDLDALQQAIDDQMGTSEGEHVAYAEADNTFHMELSRICGNLFFRKVMFELQPSISYQQLEIMSLSENEQRRLRAESQEDHRKMIEAIRSSDSTRAGQLMRQHITRVYEFFRTAK